MRSIGLLIVAAALAPPAYQDITVRYHNDSKALPAGAADQTIRIKGSRTSSNLFNLIALTDFAKQELTLVDAAGKRFATIPLSQFGAKVEAHPCSDMQAFAAQMFDPSKTVVAKPVPAGLRRFWASP